ncbi:MAG: hypothetical protein JWQ09_1826 [Segetibacter sp.]|nr:hypothetical protein [Segetibacter sp.]
MKRIELNNHPIKTCSNPIDSNLWTDPNYPRYDERETSINDLNKKINKLKTELHDAQSIYNFMVELDKELSEKESASSDRLNNWRVTKLYLNGETITGLTS